MTNASIYIPGLENLLAAVNEAVGGKPVEIYVRAFEHGGSSTVVLLLENEATAGVTLNWGGVVEAVSWWGTNQEVTADWEAAAEAIWAAVQRLESAATAA